MIVEILLQCTVDECPHNIGCVCRATKSVAINHHGVCEKAGSLRGFQKNPKNNSSVKSLCDTCLNIGTCKGEFEIRMVVSCDGYKNEK